MTNRKIGDAILYNGDCLDILPEIKNWSAIIADPPYTLSLANDCAKKVNPWANLINSAVFIRSWLSLATASLEKSSCAWIFHNWQSHPAYQKAGFDLGCPMKSLLVWNKGNLGPGMIGLRPSYELVGFFPINGYKIKKRNVRDVWEIDWPTYRPHGHSAEKPLALMERLIEISTEAGDVVLDPFMGCGTVGVAALKLGRKYIGIELDPRWYDVACERIAHYRSE